MTEQLADDGRRWYVCGASTWSGVQLYAAPTARAALTLYRRDLTAAERADGRSIRETRMRLAAAGLQVLSGPLTTPQAHDLDLALTLADEATRWTNEAIEIPLGAPIHPGDTAALFSRLDTVKADRIRAHVLARYQPES